MTENESMDSTDTTDTTNRPTETTDRTMDTVDHTHPDTNRPFGEQVAFERGPTVAADGGEPVAPDSDEETRGTMKDVAHVPPADAEPNRVFERGREGRDGDR